MIYTFYSYKGGVGRSMALANVAQWLCSQGIRVVMVDWDLEAPGLENFFFAAEDELEMSRSQIGVIDMLESYRRQFPHLSLSPDLRPPLEPSDLEKVVSVLEKELPPLSSMLLPIRQHDTDASPAGALWLLTAGWRSGDRFPHYARSVQGFDWADFYERFAGEAYFEWMRRQFLAPGLGQVVLIDSRTGVTEMGGVCTRQLADVVVTFCAANLQNLTGVSMMAGSFKRDDVTERRKQQGRPPLEVVMVPARIDTSELDARSKFKERFLTNFEGSKPLRFRAVPGSLWDLRIPYVPKYAYEERLAMDASDTAEELVAAYQKLASHLMLLAPPDSALPRARWGSPDPLSGPTQGPGDLPAVWNIPYSRNPHLTGRDDMLHQVRDWLLGPEHAGKPLVICGLGGVGKTQLVVEHAYRQRSQYDVVWWLRADDPAKLGADYARFADSLGMPQSATTDQEGVVDFVGRWLQMNQRWLLVFDDARDPAEVREYLRHKGAGHVLITSRNPNWRGLATVTSLEALSPATAAIFLMQRTGETDPGPAHALAEELGGLPLALEQAGAYIEATGRSISDYLQLFRQHATRLLRENTSEADTTATVGVVLERSFAEVAATSAVAADLLTLCAFLAPDSIPLDMIVDGARWLQEPLATSVTDPLSLDELIAALRRYSLIDLTDRSLAMHRLVQVSVRGRLPPAEKPAWAEAAVRLVGAALPSYADIVDSSPLDSRLLAHALASADNADSLNVAKDAAAEALTKVAAFFYTWKRVPVRRARDLLDRAVTIAEAAGPDVGADPSTAAELWSLLGQALHMFGELGRAKASYERALNLLEATHGPQHLSVADALNGIGDVLRDQQDRPGARARYQRALEIHEAAATDSRDPAIVDDLARLISVLTVIKTPPRPDRQPDGLEAVKPALDNQDLQLKGVQDRIERILDAYETAKDQDRHTLGKLRTLLGKVLRTSGDLVGARASYEAALATYEDAYGPSHPEVGGCLDRLGDVLRDLGDLTAARHYYERALAVHEAAYGPDHSTVGEDLVKLAEVLDQTGEPERSRSLLERALAIEQAFHGDDHPAVATIHKQLGVVLSRLEHLHEARTHFELAVAIDQAVYGPDHSVVRDDLIHLFACLLVLGDFAAARERLEQPPLDQLPSGFLSLGDSLLKLKRLDEAAAEFGRGLEQAEQAGNLAVRAGAHARLGYLSTLRDNVATALTHFRESLQSFGAAEIGSAFWWLVGACSNLVALAGATRSLDDTLRVLQQDPDVGGQMRRYRPQTSAPLPDGWFVKDSITLVAPDGQANVIFSTEPLDPSIDAEHYATLQGDLLAREFSGYEEFELKQEELLGGKTCWLRHFQWTPSDGVPITQIQLYYAEDAHGYTATATTPTSQFPRLELQLRQLLGGLLLER
jgi:tetratricopeptide (TPR) repeat protein